MIFFSLVFPEKRTKQTSNELHKHSTCTCLSKTVVAYFFVLIPSQLIVFNTHNNIGKLAYLFLLVATRQANASVKLYYLSYDINLDWLSNRWSYLYWFTYMFTCTCQVAMNRNSRQAYQGTVFCVKNYEFRLNSFGYQKSEGDARKIIKNNAINYRFMNTFP